MRNLTETVRNCGDLAATHELLRAGHPARRLTHAVHTGELIRVRQGWYCTPEVPQGSQEAVRVGGRLSCISGCEHHGLWVRRTSLLHVAVDPRSSRLRSRTDKRVRLRDTSHSKTIVHWRTSAPGTSRFVLNVRDCLKCMVLCRSPEEVVAAVDSALRLRKLSLSDWAEDVAGCPRRLRHLLSRVDARSESITESVTRFRLQCLGINPWLQVRIAGVGRVDLLIGDRLVVELDGWGYHSNPEQFEADRRRDAKLSARGYRVLRFSYRQVFGRWHEVRAAVLAAMSRGDHLG